MDIETCSFTLSGLLGVNTAAHDYVEFGGGGMIKEGTHGNVVHLILLPEGSHDFHGFRVDHTAAIPCSSDQNGKVDAESNRSDFDFWMDCGFLDKSPRLVEVNKISGVCSHEKAFVVDIPFGFFGDRFDSFLCFD
jgi:hypothetical protein